MMRSSENVCNIGHGAWGMGRWEEGERGRGGDGEMGMGHGAWGIVF
ncbi:MAG: hypothetical protein QQW96_11440 [Tychonema bourrellyi B0820]|nr:hypothetical protein [Tychonema bourrellyi B0820]